jgi:bifunctional non-homologous end joining protein LigD
MMPVAATPWQWMHPNWMPDAFTYAGSAFVTLPQTARYRFWREAAALRIDSPAVRGIARRAAAFVRPSLRVRAKHLKGEGMLRHASLTGLV